VGDVSANNIPVSNWQVFIDNGFVPVLAPLTHDSAGHIMNTNADTMAAAIAVSLSSQYEIRLLYCFEKKGVLESVDNDDSVIRTMNKKTYSRLKEEQKLFAGILPKLDNAFAAIDAGVREVLIGHADDLLQNTTHSTTGTLISE
jgi:acetylglutamate kinase